MIQVLSVATSTDLLGFCGALYERNHQAPLCLRVTNMSIMKAWPVSKVVGLDAGCQSLLRLSRLLMLITLSLFNDSIYKIGVEWSNFLTLKPGFGWAIV